MDSHLDDRSSSGRVAPFRHPRIVGYVLLPEAFRSLSRLSSALSAKASALCFSCLTLAGEDFLSEISLLTSSIRRIALRLLGLFFKKLSSDSSSFFGCRYSVSLSEYFLTMCSFQGADWNLVSCWFLWSLG